MIRNVDPCPGLLPCFHLTIVCFDDVFDYAQAKSGSAFLSRAPFVHYVEALEYTSQIFGWNPISIITDCTGNVVSVFGNFSAHKDFREITCIFESIVDKIPNRQRKFDCVEWKAFFSSARDNLSFSVSTYGFSCRYKSILRMTPLSLLLVGLTAPSLPSNSDKLNKSSTSAWRRIEFLAIFSKKEMRRSSGSKESSTKVSANP